MLVNWSVSSETARSRPVCRCDSVMLIGSESMWASGLEEWLQGGRHDSDIYYDYLALTIGTMRYSGRCKLIPSGRFMLWYLDQVDDE